MQENINISPFLVKLWRMVNDPALDNQICWNENGTSFIIKTPSTFCYELLPLYYKHNNMSSFVRQLNFYGFHKINNLSVHPSQEKEGLYAMQFVHPLFRRDAPELLKDIKRKVATSKISEVPTFIRQDDLSKVLTDVKQLRGRQTSVDSQLSAMKQENAMLWRELACLRQKHVKQQQIVNKLIQFLVTLVQPAASPRMGVGVKRRMPLMLHECSPKKSRSHKTSRNQHEGGPTIHELEPEVDLSPEQLLGEASIIDAGSPLVNFEEFEQAIKEVMEGAVIVRIRIQRVERGLDNVSVIVGFLSIPNSGVFPLCVIISEEIRFSQIDCPVTPNSQGNQDPDVQLPVASPVATKQNNSQNDRFEEPWDKPDFVNVDDLNDGASDNDEELINTLQKNAESADKVFLNPNSRHTLIGNLMSSATYNNNATGRKSVTDRKKQIGNGSSIVTPPRVQAVVQVAAKNPSVKINNRDDLDSHVDSTQSELDQLKDILNGCNSFDANTLLGLFVDNDPDFQLKNDAENKEPAPPEGDDSTITGNEVAPVNNVIDFTELFDDDVDSVATIPTQNSSSGAGVQGFH